MCLDDNMRVIAIVESSSSLTGLGGGVHTQILLASRHEN